MQMTNIDLKGPRLEGDSNRVETKTLLSPIKMLMW